MASGVRVSRESLFSAMAELSGPQALREFVLDREIERLLDDRGVSIGRVQIEAERVRLVESIGGDLEGRDTLAEDVLSSRGLGPVRRESLLRRNAALRALVADRVEVGEDAVALAHAIEHGETRTVRVLIARTVRDAVASRERIAGRAQQTGLTAAFAEEAFARSIDQSSSLGGLLGEVSLLDPGITASLRSAIRDAEVGVIGPVIALDRAFALVLVERVVPADGTPLEAVRGRLEARVRARAERLEMNRLAETLIGQAEITPLDDSLRWAWDRSGAGG
ncbi:MAG: hypothetical protein AAGF47_10780 [Planctomycetota bacterium]